jgi:iron complex outermembrane receptor protein
MGMFRFVVLAGVSLVGLSTAARAQEAVADEAADRASADEIVVTGTLVRGIAPPGANVIGVTAQAVQETGAANTSQLLATIPQLGTFNTLQSPALGFTTVTTNRPNLRNLPGDRTSGSSPTLVLLDGHRVVGAGISVTSPDPDIIPPSLIERVEIVPDGGSAIYGSDAVAGVINFITKKRFDGIEVGARYGFGDNYHTFDANVTVGHSWGTGGIFAAYSYAENDSIFGRDRDFSFSPLTITDSLQVRSLRCYTPNVTIGGTGAAGVYAVPYVPGTSVAGAVNQCDETDPITIFPEQRRHSVMAGLNQELSDNLTLDIRAFYTNRKITSFVGPYRGDVTFGTNAAAGQVGGPFYAPNVVGETQHVYFAFGNDSSMVQVNKLNTWGVAPTLTAQLGGGWQLRALTSFGESHARFDGVQTNAVPLATAIGLGLVNPFNIGASPNQTALQALGNFEQYGEAKQRQFDARLILDGELLQLPGGGVKVAVGVEYINEAFGVRNAQIQVGTENTGYAGLAYDGVTLGPVRPGATTIIPVQGAVPQITLSRQTKSVFGELVVPVFGSGNATTLFQELTLSAAGRYDHYSSVGGTFNPKFGLTWRPVDWVKLRGAWGKSFVAPSLADDPSTTINSVNFVNLAFLLPQSALVTSGFVPSPAATGGGTRSQIVVLGNKPGIDSQKSTTWSVGFDIDPPFAPGLRLGMTYWNIDYSGIIALPTFTSPQFYQNFVGTPAITFNPSQAQVDALFGAGTTSNGVPCQGVDVAAAGTGCYVIIDARKQNLSRTKLSGLDFNVNYVTETSFGSIDFAFNGNYELTRTQQATITSPFLDQLSANFSRFRFRTALGADIGNFRAQIAWSHSHGYSVFPAVGVGTTQTRVGSFNVVDLFFKYDLKGENMLKDTSLTLNVNNAFDTDPPLYLLANSLQPQANGFTNGSTVGRLIQIGFNKKF